MDIKILVATHKKYIMPNESIYLPIHVGKEGKEDLGYIGDNTGDNISIKNPYYCELTALYWAWKNLNCDFIGLCHYRRYFRKPLTLKKIDINKTTLNEKDIIRLMNKYDVVVPKRIKLNVYDEYCTYHNQKDLDNTIKIINELYPDYSNACKIVMDRDYCYIFNMFIMSKDNFNNYCEWLFNILSELEKITDISSYDTYQKRLYGFLGERLFNVWLCKHSELKIKELRFFNLEL